MSVYDVAEKFNEKYRKISYPESMPPKPKQEDFSSYCDWGIKMDEWQKEFEKYKQKKLDYRKEVHEVEQEFKKAIGKDLGLLNHPKFDRMYGIAYENGHSSGFTEVAIHCEELAELLT